MKLYFRTLTPLHIGNGEELAPLEYVVQGDTFYKVTQDQFISFLADRVPKGRNAFSKWITEQFKAMREIEDNRELSRLENQINPFTFCKSINKERDFINYLRQSDNQIFRVPVIIDDHTRQRTKGNSQIALGRVREALKNGRMQPYLPGSSLKGAIRTALFYQYLKEHANQNEIAKTVRRQLDNKIKKERFANPLEQSVFYCGLRDAGKKKVKPDDEKMDVFKLVRVADGRFREPGRAMSMAKINIYLVQRMQDSRTKNIYWTAEPQRQTSYSEIISAGQVLETELDFDIDFLVRAKAWMHDEAIPAGDAVQWIGLEKKVRQIFNLDLSTLTEQNKEEKRQAVIDHLLQTVQAFSQRQMEEDQKWLNNFLEHDRRGNYKTQLQDGFAPVFARREQSLTLHLGYATGFKGTTAVLYFLEDAKRTELYKEVMERFGIGKKPQHKGAYTASPKRFPKSKRLVEGRNRIEPLGWLERVNEQAENLPPERMAETVEEEKEETPPADPEYFAGKVNYKKPPELDAEVVRSGRQNTVKVYIYPDYSPELPLNGYRNPLEIGAVVRVKTEFTKKGKLVQVSFLGFKR